MAARPRTALIIGANRGIGFQLAKRLQQRGYQVFGTYRRQSRDDESVKELIATGIKTFEVDVIDEQSIIQAAEDFGSRPLDLLINVAGIFQLWDEKPFTEQSSEDLLRHFRVNVIGPFLTSKAFLPALTLADVPKIINMSSDMASISENWAGNACYRISKTGLNQLTKTMALDLKKMLKSKVLTLAVHPGWLPTRMTGFYGEDDMDVCMSSLVDVIERFGTPEGENLPHGGYVKWNGEQMAY